MCLAEKIAENQREPWYRYGRALELGIDDRPDFVRFHQVVTGALNRQ